MESLRDEFLENQDTLLEEMQSISNRVDKLEGQSHHEQPHTTASNRKQSPLTIVNDGTMQLTMKQSLPASETDGTTQPAMEQSFFTNVTDGTTQSSRDNADNTRWADRPEDELPD